MEQEMEMEMTRDELNKMTKRDLMEHVKLHGKKPNRQSIIKGRLIDLIIEGGFNKPPPTSYHFNKPLPKKDESESSESSEKDESESSESSEKDESESSEKEDERGDCGKRLDFEMMD